MTEAKAIRIDYRKLNPVCSYCEKTSESIRVTTTTTGDVLVSTLCDFHSKDEPRFLVEEKGMVLAGETTEDDMFSNATLFDPEVAKKIKKRLEKAKRKKAERKKAKKTDDENAS